MTHEHFEVVILNDYASVTGGSSAVALAEAVGLARNGFSVTLFTCVGPISPELHSIPGLRVICLDQEEIAKNPRRFQALVQGIRNRPAIEHLGRLLAGKRPERTIVHAHTWTKALSPYALATASSLGFPLVVTLHDFFISCPNGGFFDHRTGQVCERRPLSKSCWTCNCDRRIYAHKLWRNVRTVVQNRVLNLPARISAFVGVSEFSLNLLRPHLPGSVPIHVVRNPVGAKDVGPALVAENREFMAIGRFENEKGMQILAEAAQATGLPAVFVGDGPLAPKLRRLCPGARFTGWLSPADTQRELARARALVFSPIWYETLGLAALEAAAAGVPAIVSDRCAATDFIHDGVNGLHFRNGSALSLGVHMRAIAADDALAARLGRTAYDQYWADPWTVERHVADLIPIYEEVLRRRGRVPEEKFHESIAGFGARS